MNDSKYLRPLRRAADMTQYQLHVTTGISRVRISMAETCQLALTETEWKSIIRVLSKNARKRSQRIERLLQSESQSAVS